MKHILLLLSIFSITACSDNDESVDLFLNCDDVMENFTTYNGEEIDCQFHYVLTEYNSQQFIELRAHCADLTRSYVINENCVDICETSPYDPDSECGKYLQNREEIKIILIAK